MSWGGDGQDQWGNGSGYGGSGYGGYRRRGRGSFPQPQPAHDPYEVKLPNWLESVMTCEGVARWSSIIMLDTRDARMVSPFQAWLVKEIMTNSASSINVLTERDHVMPPTSGYHLSLFAKRSMVSRLRSPSRWTPTQEFRVEAGTLRQQERSLTRLFSPSAGQFFGTAPRATT